MIIKKTIFCVSIAPDWLVVVRYPLNPTTLPARFHPEAKASPDWENLGAYCDWRTSSSCTIVFESDATTGEIGEKHGQGTFTFSDGEKIKGTWRKDGPYNCEYFDKIGNLIGKFYKNRFFFDNYLPFVHFQPRHWKNHEIFSNNFLFNTFVFSCCCPVKRDRDPFWMENIYRDKMVELWRW